MVFYPDFTVKPQSSDHSPFSVDAFLHITIGDVTFS